MMPSEKNTKRVVLALDQAYEKFIQLEDESTDEAEIVAYRCYYTNIYESKLYVEQMQKEIDCLKAEKDEIIRKIGHARIDNIVPTDAKPTEVIYRHGVVDGLAYAQDIVNGKAGEQE